MIKTTKYHNANCIKCNAVNPVMVKIGAIIMCDSCFKVEFNIDTLITVEQKETYYKWLKKYQEES